jgi:O-antigen ligase
VLPVVLAPLLPTMAVAALAVVSMCVMALAFARERERQLTFSPVNKYVLIYAGVYLVGTFASVTPAASLKEGLLRVCFTLFPLVLLNALNSRAQLLGVVKLMVLMGAVVSVYGMYQYVFRTGYQSAAWVDSDMFSAIGFRVGSTFDNPNMLGQYLVLLIPLGGACLLRARTGKERGLWFVCCGLMCVCMLRTFSRGAWLALLCAGLAFFVLLNPRLLLLAPFALAALYFVLPETVIQRFTSIGDLADNSTSYRVSIWLGTLRMLKDYWLCGVGPGQTAFNTVYPAYGYDEIVAPHSHNLLLQITTDAGICALVMFCLILFWYFRSLCSGLHREKDWTGRLLQIACISGLGGFMVQSMTDYSFYNYRVMFLFWAFLALGMAAARWHELKGEDRL